jgi:hypothetical protein
MGRTAMAIPGDRPRRKRAEAIPATIGGAVQALPIGSQCARARTFVREFSGTGRAFRPFPTDIFEQE